MEPQGDYNLIQSLSFGSSHDDTVVFDDVAQFALDPHLSHIQEIEVEFDDSKVYGLTVTYYRGPGQVQKVHHVGSAQGEKRVETIRFAVNEYITRASGLAVDAITHLKIETSRLQVIDIGGNDGTPFDFQIPENYTVLGLQGGLGGHLHTFSLILKPINTWNPQQSNHTGKVLSDTRPWDDLPLLDGAFSCKIIQIKGFCDQIYVVGLEIHYLVNGSQPRCAGWHKGGSTNGLQAEKVLRFAWDEYIVKVDGKSGDVIDSLRIVTNKGQELILKSEGRDTGGEFNLEIPPGKRVVAFGGGLCGHLHNLYVYYN